MRRPSPKVWSKAASEVLYSFSFVQLRSPQLLHLKSHRPAPSNKCWCGPAASSAGLNDLPGLMVRFGGFSTPTALLSPLPRPSFLCRRLDIRNDRPVGLYSTHAPKPIEPPPDLARSFVVDSPPSLPPGHHTIEKNGIIARQLHALRA